MEPHLDMTSHPMEQSDLDHVVSIERRSFVTPWTRNMFVQEITNTFSTPLVFRVGGQMVGYACVWGVTDEMHILNVAVHPEMRQQGYGLAILAHLDSVAREHQAKRIILEVGRRNQEARRLYRKWGYHTIGFRKNYYCDIGDDAFVMEKRLDNPLNDSVPAQEAETR